MASTVWADSRRSKANEAFMQKAGLCVEGPSQEAVSQAYALAYPEIQRWKVRYPVACRACLADQKSQTGLLSRIVDA